MNPSDAFPKARPHSLGLYNCYAVLSGAYFWMPLFVLYFSGIVSLRRVFLLESIYYAAVSSSKFPRAISPMPSDAGEHCCSPSSSSSSPTPCSSSAPASPSLPSVRYFWPRDLPSPREPTHPSISPSFRPPDAMKNTAPGKPGWPPWASSFPPPPLLSAESSPGSPVIAPPTHFHSPVPSPPCSFFSQSTIPTSAPDPPLPVIQSRPLSSSAGYSKP